MLRAIKYELNPTKTQKEQIKQTCGCCRELSAEDISKERKEKSSQTIGIRL